MKEYEAVRHSLIDMLEDLDDRLAKITHDIKEPLDKDFEEQATQAENDEVLDGLGNAARTEIELVKQAIARIDKGQYGLCQVCAQPISKERLKAIPYSSLCMKCASSQSGLLGNKS
ncbi:TraR/DksA family transcriptional regulator [Methylobacter svalbardensis]|uniref:TraR/DksA family transcriptional regulator n=1 Tax=Methylobacter svalbardensis TaxID=3080016 RepID=UPI0030EEC7D7